MKLSEQKQYYEDTSGIVSDITRGLNYGLIAIVWILCNNKVENLPQYKGVLALIIVSLVVDLFQYLWRTVACAVCFRRNEKSAKADGSKKKDDPDVPVFPLFINTVTWILFGLKIVFMAGAAFWLFIKIIC